MKNDVNQPDYRRLLQTIRHEEPDRVPLAEIVVDRPIMSAFLERPVDTLADEVAFWHEAGYDYMYQRANYEFPGVPIEAAAGTRIRFENDVPKTSKKSHDMMHLGGLVTSMEDLDSLELPDPQTVDDTPLDALAELLPAGMGLITGVGGIFTRAWMLLGFERMAMGFYEAPELIAAVFERIGSIQCEVLRRLVKKGRVFAVWYGDDLAYTEGLMVAPALLRKYLFPWLEEIAAIAHDHGMPLIMHSDGRLTDILDDLVALGLDALHPIEPKAMDIRDLKQRYQNQLTLIGNVDLNILGMGTPEETYRHTHELLRDLAPGGGYVLGSSNSISNYVKIENYRAMLAAARDFRRQ